jgi:glycosyltransferase involved in cell wall biosynthesis
MAPDAIRHRPRHVLMLGEGLERQGGIVTVQKLILAMAGDQLRFSHIATLKDGSGARKTLVYLGALARLANALLRGKVDLVHIHVSIGGSVYRQIVTATLARLAGRPVIMHAHAGEFPEFFARQPAPLRWLIREVLRRSDRLVVLSPHWRRVYGALLGLPAEWIQVLTNPVALPASLPARTVGDKTRLVYLGRISQPKGAFDLIRALALLPASCRRGIAVTIAGDGEVEGARALVRKLGLEPAVTVRDWLRPAERDALLAAADIYLLPSYFERMPMALMEAMSFGLAAITTPVGGIPDVVEDGENGLLVPPGDLERLATAITALLQDPDRRRRLGEAARASMAPYAKEHYAPALLALYRELTDRQQAAASEPAR